MVKNKKESFFWTSYSDLMTSLFFVMLVLFVLGLVISKNANKKLQVKNVELETTRSELEQAKIELQQAYDSLKGTAEATQKQLDKITELERSIKNIDTKYFGYDDKYKTHVLKTKVKFKRGSASFADLSYNTKQELYAVRDLLRQSMESFKEANPNASYFLIIEGQASYDSYSLNNELSYKRALALFKFWFPNQKTTTLNFYNLPCEVIIAGAGCMEGKPRAYLNEDNQRFLIRILPKPGLIEE